jgi:hypothetical protein
VDIDARETDRQPCDRPLDRPLRDAARDQTDVGRRPAHVERDRVLEAGRGRDPGGADDAARRPREQRPRGVRRGLLERGDSAGGSHHERLGEAAGPSLLAQSLQVPAERRPEVGIGCCRGGALVLAKLGCDLMRRDHVRVRIASSKLVRDGSLVRRVAEREEQADGNRLGLELR